MNLETINKIFLELSQVATASTAKELQLREALEDANDKLRSAMEIARRDGVETNWPAFRNRFAREQDARAMCGQIDGNTHRVVQHGWDEEEQSHTS